MRQHWKTWYRFEKARGARVEAGDRLKTGIMAIADCPASGLPGFTFLSGMEHHEQDDAPAPQEVRERGRAASRR